MDLKRKLNEECGVAGIIGMPDASYYAYLCLYALQHRGQEACGIVSFNGDTIDAQTHFKRSFGLVSEVFKRDDFPRLAGKCAVGHVRYSTSGSKKEQNIQPFNFKSIFGHIAIAHNGNLTNAQKIKDDLVQEGSIFQSDVDSEVFMHLLAKSLGSTIAEKIKSTVLKVAGAYSLVISTHDRMFAIRDPHGFRPLVIGKKGDAFLAVSETCALDLVGAEFIREVEPGEIVEMTIGGELNSYKFSEATPKFCAFEPIYFARPDSKIFEEEIYTHRRNIGEQLAEEAPAEADTIFAVPDSGVPMAIGYGDKLNLPVELGLVRNHYVGRTFIQPDQNIRDFAVKLKLNPVKSVLKGKSVVVVDDSLVRGTTCKKIIRMIRAAGAKKIHVRIGSPPITHSCYYGVDTPKRNNLLASQSTVDQICQKLGADSIAFLSQEGLQKVLNKNSSENKYCLACFNGKYPVDPMEKISIEPTDELGTGLSAKLML